MSGGKRLQGILKIRSHKIHTTLFMTGGVLSMPQIASQALRYRFSLLIRLTLSVALLTGTAVFTPTAYAEKFE